MKHVNTIPTDNATWTDIDHMSPDQQYRINIRKGIETLWRKQNHPAFYGGHQIKLVPLDSRLAREWLDAAGYDTFALNMASKH